MYCVHHLTLLVKIETFKQRDSNFIIIIIF